MLGVGSSNLPQSRTLLKERRSTPIREDSVGLQ
jgi:hypothetical protein